MKIARIIASAFILYGLATHHIHGFGPNAMAVPLLAAMWFGVNTVHQTLFGPPRRQSQTTSGEDPEVDSFVPTVPAVPEGKEPEFELAGVRVTPVQISGEHYWKSENGQIFDGNGRPVNIKA